MVHSKLQEVETLVVNIDITECVDM